MEIYEKQTIDKLPLTGIRVIELGQIAAGPFAGSLFADLGADVVKIERPDGGDGMRQWPPLTAASAPSAAFSENFASVNRNKRSVALDLKNADDVARLKQLVATSLRRGLRCQRQRCRCPIGSWPKRLRAWQGPLAR